MPTENIEIVKTNLETIQPFRVMFLHENNFQFCYDKCHYYGWSDDYAFKLDETIIGYGCVWGTGDRGARDSIFEFFLVPPYRNIATAVFKLFIDTTGATYIESQSNDLFLTALSYEFSETIVPEALLMEEEKTTNLRIDDVLFKRKETGDPNPEHYGGYYLECNGEEVATGGFLTNYNKPYADIYMDVKEGHRQKGYGSFMVQELKREVYAIGKVPAARTNVTNIASKATLLKAGFKVCGARLKGKIRRTI
jgi:GNAT superfamily N-acetyltransferase